MKFDTVENQAGYILECDKQQLSGIFGSDHGLGEYNFDAEREKKILDELKKAGGILLEGENKNGSSESSKEWFKFLEKVIEAVKPEVKRGNRFQMYEKLHALFTTAPKNSVFNNSMGAEKCMFALKGVLPTKVEGVKEVTTNTVASAPPF